MEALFSIEVDHMQGVVNVTQDLTCVNCGVNITIVQASPIANLRQPSI